MKNLSQWISYTRRFMNSKTMAIENQPGEHYSNSREVIVSTTVILDQSIWDWHIIYLNSFRC